MKKPSAPKATRAQRSLPNKAALNQLTRGSAGQRTIANFAKKTPLTLGAR